MELLPRLALLLAAAQALLAAADAKKLPFGARLGVKRVRAPARTPAPAPAPAAPFLIDWRNIGDFAQPEAEEARQEKSLADSYLPPPGPEAPAAEPPAEPPADDPPAPATESPIVPVPTPGPWTLVPTEPPPAPAPTPGPWIPIEGGPTPGPWTTAPPPPPGSADDPPLINPEVPGVIIDPVTPDTEAAAPPCSLVTETVFDTIEETSCRIVNASSCSPAPSADTPTGDCYRTLADTCEDVTEVELQRVCEEQLAPVCEEVTEQLTRNECGFVNETKCEPEYETQYKDECTYETVFEEVCSTGYLVSYQDKCDGLGKLLLKSCKKVPVWPSKQCRQVPRTEGKCKKVPVLRPTNCLTVERVLCTEVPYTRASQQCVLASSPVCADQPVAVVRNVCSTLETETCTLLRAPDTGDSCAAEKICETRRVPFTRTVEREDCSLPGAAAPATYSGDYYSTTFL